MNNEPSGKAIGCAAMVLLGVLFTIIATCMWGCPNYNVYTQSKEGEAVLAHANFSREVAVAEAKAKMESAKLLAQAEIERAKGVAEANRIIGEGLRGHEEYLRYLWIQHLGSGNQVIYVPTEANLPILEATRKVDTKLEAAK